MRTKHVNEYGSFGKRKTSPLKLVEVVVQVVCPWSRADGMANRVDLHLGMNDSAVPLGNFSPRLEYSARFVPPDGMKDPAVCLKAFGDHRACVNEEWV